MAFVDSVGEATDIMKHGSPTDGLDAEGATFIEELSAYDVCPDEDPACVG
jgi:hypothetical protein